MTYKELADLAVKIWGEINTDLDDRGCFNGIDDEVMDELSGSQIVTIRLMLLEAHGLAIRNTAND